MPRKPFLDKGTGLHRRSVHMNLAKFLRAIVHWVDYHLVGFWISTETPNTCEQFFL